MTAAEQGDFSRAMKLVELAQTMGASHRNLGKAVGYIKSIAPPGSFDMPPPNARSDGPTASVRASGGTSSPSHDFSVTVRDGVDVARLGLHGEAICTVGSDCTLSLRPRGATHTRPDNRWPLPLLRRYGRRGTCFYFESGRRCASGPATLFLETAAIDAIFDAVEAQLATFRARTEGDRAIKANAIAALQEQKRAEEARAAAERAAAIAKYKKEAEKQVRLEQEAAAKSQRAREKVAEALKRRDEADRERRKSVSPSASTDARTTMISKRNSAAQLRHEQARQLTLSKRAEAKLEPKTRTNAADLFGEGAAQEEEWGAGKSKIWKALNPKPLYYETAKDRREKEEGARSLGIVGASRNFNVRRDMLTPELTTSGAAASTSVVSPPTITEEGDSEDGQQEVENADADDDDLADQFDGTADDGGGESDGEEDLGEDEDGEVGELDSGLLAMLEKNRLQREQEAEDRQRKLKEEYARKQREKQEEIDKELAVIAVKKKLEQEKKERERDEAVKEAQARLENELVFDFTFS